MVPLRRSRSREVALQLLYERDQNKTPMSRPAVEAFAKARHLSDPVAIAFSLELYDGVCEHLKAIDTLIQETATNWRLHRMLPSDRNVLRLACYELCYSKDAEATQIVLNEAIELARRFGTADSGSFVNGILDPIAKKRPAKATPEPNS